MTFYNKTGDRPRNIYAPPPDVTCPPLEINSVRDQAQATMLAEKHRPPLDDRVYDMGAPSPGRFWNGGSVTAVTILTPVWSKWRITIPYWVANLSWQPPKADEPGLLLRLVMRHLLGLKVVDTTYGEQSA